MESFERNSPFSVTSVTNGWVTNWCVPSSNRVVLQRGLHVTSSPPFAPWWRTIGSAHLGRIQANLKDFFFFFKDNSKQKIYDPQ